MAKSENKKFGWLIKNFSSLKSDPFYSDLVVIGDTKWRLSVYPKGETKFEDYLALYLNVADYESLPSGWRRYAKFRLSIVNQISQELSVQNATTAHFWFDQKNSSWGYRQMIPFTKLNTKNGGFLVNDELLIAAEVDVLDVIGVLDKSKEASEVKKIKQDDDGEESKDLLKKSPLEKERVDVNGFQVYPSQVESVRRIFELHPDIAVGFCGKNKDLRAAYMNFLLSLMETLRQPLEELSVEELEEADIALGYLKNANFKVDWLDMELDQAKEKAQARVKN